MKDVETLSLTDRQGIEICDNVGKLLANELDSREVRNKVERTVTDYLKSQKMEIDAPEITKKLDWSVNVRLEK